MKIFLDNELIDHFKNEISTKGDTWRLFRSSTFLDLINVDIQIYQFSSESSHLINAFNNCIKAQILNKINISGDLIIDSNKFNTDNFLVINEYLYLFEQFKNSGYPKNDRFGNLNDITNYIKVIAELDLNNFKEDLFKDISCFIYNKLLNSNFK
ncbi:hypothetical protein ACEN2I_18220 [Flavobacterium sp. W22_SRS_FK3]|uniref:hypothetical protein n=1 Tax=Flavobacterium sp. W22_SRS_FK3 TaxID=3240275 RepID=UPI003F8EBAE5